jgi:ubiquinone/menaquinone biosynthesis C-methylase UbiE
MVHIMEDSKQVTDSGAPQAPDIMPERARRAASFGAAAADYARYRPDYPVDGIKWVLTPVIERHNSQKTPVKVLDLGAGTGKLTAQLASLDAGAGPMSVTAVEPDPQMLAELRRQLPGVEAIAGRAEEIPLPDGSFDAVLAGQAVHWFDLDRAIPEMARVLRPGGVMGGLWNADDNRVDWVAGLHEASGRRTVVPVAGQERDDEEMSDWLTEAGKNLFWPVQEAEFSHGLIRTADSMVATLRTHSAFLIMEPAEREAAFKKVRDYLAATEQTASGEFSLPMITLAIRALRR